MIEVNFKVRITPKQAAELLKQNNEFGRIDVAEIVKGKKGFVKTYSLELDNMNYILLEGPVKEFNGNGLMDIEIIN
jgi:hypothetical protein